MKYFSNRVLKIDLYLSSMSILFPYDRSSFTIYMTEATFREEIFLKLSLHQAGAKFTVSVTMY